MRGFATFLMTAALAAGASAALAWGDNGHKTIALIAEHFLESATRAKVRALLAADPDNLTAHDIASEATWADKYRDSNHRQDHYQQTQKWHFVDLEITDPDLKSACYGRPDLPQGVLASDGPADDCILDKISQFAAELAAPNTDLVERIFALKFLLHFVGDLHQPLHSADNNDRGGNGVKISADGIDHKARDVLHSYWDTQFVDAIERRSSILAERLIAGITPDQVTIWATKDAEDWASEAFTLAQEDVYGDPPLSTNMPQHLDAGYVERAKRDVALQLSKAGVRLAFVLNAALSPEVPTGAIPSGPRPNDP